MGLEDQKRTGDEIGELGRDAGRMAGNALWVTRTGAKAAAGTAAGAAGGVPGAVLAAAWAGRHTLFKVLVCVCLALLFLIVLVVSLPSILMNRLFGLDGTKPAETDTPFAVYGEMSSEVAGVIEKGYGQALEQVETIISEGGYDHDRSMEALVDLAKYSAGYDVSYILAAYSVSMEQKEVKKADMLSKLEGVSGKMFPVSSVPKSEETDVPASYTVYEPVTLEVVVKEEQTGSIDGVPQYRYETEEQTYYTAGEILTTDRSMEVDTYESIEVTVPIYTGGEITGTKKEICYRANGKKTVSPSRETIRFVECTIHPFDSAVIMEAFGVDPDAAYGDSGRTYAEVTDSMAAALKKTLYGSAGNGQTIPLTDGELLDFVNRQECSDTRKHLLVTALSLVGKVPYFWGGKSGPGWNEAWGTPKLVTAEGSPASGTMQPYGLDCSGFTDWTYKTALGTALSGGTAGQWDGSYEISAEELLPGDLGFRMGEGGEGSNHVLVFAGYDTGGERMWVHADHAGIAFNSPSYESSLKLRRVKDIDLEAPLSLGFGTPVALEVEVTHYCPCAKCNGKNAGITATGKTLAAGMVAMSSYYPFGTQIMINGILYTVEDRGGAGIENNIHRVDIFVPTHEEALRLGRYKTTAMIYGGG